MVSASHTTTVPISGMSDLAQIAMYPGTASVLNSGSFVLQAPAQIAMDGGGNLYMTEQQLNKILKYPAQGGGQLPAKLRLQVRSATQLWGLVIDR